MLNIVIPMAGRGSRFADAGYADPKPLIPVHGVPMIRLVIGNIRPSCAHRFIFICQRAHVQAYEPIRKEVESPESDVIPFPLGRFVRARDGMDSGTSTRGGSAWAALPV